MKGNRADRASKLAPGRLFPYAYDGRIEGRANSPGLSSV